MIEVQSVWGWQIALYLFLGGLGAGTFVTAACLFLSSAKSRVKSLPRDEYVAAGSAEASADVAHPAPTGDKPAQVADVPDAQPHRKVLLICTWTAAACLCVGLLLLLSDLIQPLRGLMLWQSFSNGTSWMTIGAWLVFCAVIVFVITAFCMTTHVVPSLKRKCEASHGLESFLFVLGGVLGLCVAAYTGILLKSAEGIPFWNTWLLPCLFTVSALGTGVALVEFVLLTVEHKTEEPEGEDAASAALTKRLRIAALCLIVIEAIVLISYLCIMAAASGNGTVSQAAAESANMLISGSLAGLFWVVVACALVIPFIVTLICLAIKGKSNKTIALIGALSVLVGGCALRFAILFAGVQADPIFDAISSIL